MLCRHMTREGSGRILCALLCILLVGLGTVARAQDNPPSFKPLPAPSLNFYGSVGLVDMPTAEMMPDGTFATTISHFAGQTRTTVTFQAFPWLSASFRYNAIIGLGLFGFSTYYDRSFDVRFRLLRESRRWPEVTVGLQDFAGTGVYASEYIVATKSFATPGLGRARLPGKLKITAGLGWGRFATAGSIGAPLGIDRPTFIGGSTGGQLAFDQWFRGPVAPFGGIEWQPNDKWSLKAELSTDAYEVETQRSDVFERKSRLNFGIEYQVSDRTRIGAYYLYGSEIGLTAQFQLRPEYAPTPLRVGAPTPIQPRPSIETNPDVWTTAWADNIAAPTVLRDALIPLLKAEGLVLETLDVSANVVELRFQNTRYHSNANAIGRAARVLAQVMPPSVETFRLIPMSGGLALSAVTLRRSDLEALQYDGNAAAAIHAVTGYSWPPRLSDTAVQSPELYPKFSWAIQPFFQPSYFDPAQPVRMDFGVELNASFAPAPGWLLFGAIRHRLAGNIRDPNKNSNSRLPPVRTNVVRYADEDTTLNALFAMYQWQPGKNLYGRVAAGYLEQMFGGVSGEILWKPVHSRLGLGLEASWVKQRDFEQRFGFQDYSVLTAHGSAYYDFGRGYHGRLDVGRYLAGDIGATVTFDREFDNGWLVGGFFTLTNVSAEEFGEGSFDKGIRFRIPVNWFLGKPTRRSVGATIRPIQRDGGAKLYTPGQLYFQVRDAHKRALTLQQTRFWY